MSATIPHINIYDSFLHQFNFTPRAASDLHITITRVEKATYILQYRQDTTVKGAYRVSRTPDQWEVEQIDLSPTSFAHLCHVDTIDYTSPPLEDKSHSLPNEPIPFFHSFLQVASVVAIGVAGYGAKVQFQYRRPFLGVICALMSMAFAYGIVFIRHRSKQVALGLAGRLISVVDTVNSSENKAAPSRGYLLISRDYQ